MQKIKAFRTADCVVGGFRYNEGKKVVGSLLLGLYDNDGLLHHVGYTSALRATEKDVLTAKLKTLMEPPGFTGKKPGGPSRWSTRRSTEWQPLKPKLVVEVRYDHISEDRFRHGTTYVHEDRLDDVNEEGSKRRGLLAGDHPSRKRDEYAWNCVSPRTLNGYHSERLRGTYGPKPETPDSPIGRK